jgi:predicted HicB family RNase H-like nuclease
MNKSVKSAPDEEKNKKKNTSLRLEKKVLKALKIKAIEQDTSIQQLIESLILDYLDKK